MGHNPLFSVINHVFLRERARKRRSFSLARGSVMECGALFDLFNALEPPLPGRISRRKVLLARISAMFSTRGL